MELDIVKHSEYLGFLAAVCSSPKDDTLRLIFADWLDDHSQPERSEFIRVQCELAENRPCNWGHEPAGTCEQFNSRRGEYRVTVQCKACRQRDVLRDRERELFRQHLVHRSFEEFGLRSQLWYADDGENIAIVRRGFVAEVRLSCQDWLANGPALVRRQPIERVMITDMPIYPSGGNSTFYVGGLGRFPQEYWRRLEGLPTESAALDALSKAALLWAKQTEPATASA